MDPSEDGPGLSKVPKTSLQGERRGRTSTSCLREGVLMTQKALRMGQILLKHQADPFVILSESSIDTHRSEQTQDSDEPLTIGRSSVSKFIDI